jgi:phage I-like protein
MEEELRNLLGLKPEDNIVEAVKTLMQKVKETEAQVVGAQQQASDAEKRANIAEATLVANKAKLAETEVAKDVDAAIIGRKLLPVQRDWALVLRAKDPEQFKTFLATAPTIGPDGRVLGHEGPVEDALTATEVEVAKKLGITTEAMTAQKKRDREAKA